MSTPQPGILAIGPRSHLHLEFDATDDPSRLAAAAVRIREAAGTVAGVNVVVGFGHRVWSQLAPDAVPDGFSDFTPIVGADGYEMPADQHDLWLWMHGTGPDDLFDIARLAARELDGIATLAVEQPSFVYHASQDLTGFEDGTENPPLDEAASIAFMGPGTPLDGGSIVLLQRWVHDLDGFEALAVEEREQVIGRTLNGSIELDDAVQSPRSHVSRVVIEDESGDELEVFRRSTAFGGVDRHGLVFVAFSPDRDRLQRMLLRMAGVGDGVRDHLTEFSTPTSGAWYVAPPLEAFHRFADA